MSDERCEVCGDAHAYTRRECVNFLTFGQGGADFEESQRLARLYDEETGGRDVVEPLSHERGSR